MSSRNHSPSEASPLLRTQHPPQSYDAVEDESASPQSPSDFKPPNKVSKSDLAWVLAGLWSAVFLGALDGKQRAPCHREAHTNVFPGTIVATLLSPIGSYFNESNRSSYIGTSYLLSVCCFTPLYGTCISAYRTAHPQLRIHVQDVFPTSWDGKVLCCSLSHSSVISCDLQR